MEGIKNNNKNKGMWFSCSRADGSSIFVTVSSEQIICNLVHRFNG
jgi:hypothetical protein